MYLILNSQNLIAEICRHPSYVRRQHNGVVVLSDQDEADAIYSNDSDTFYPIERVGYLCDTHRLEEVETVSGKVSKTSDDWPYIEEHMTVKMAEPRAATAIKDKIREKEVRRKKIQGEILQVEKFIKSLPEGIERQILEMVYLEEMSQRDAAELTGYSYGRISQIIKKAIKD